MHKNSNTTNNNTNTINLYYQNQMHNNYKSDEQIITNIIKRNTEIEQLEHIKLIIYYTKFKTSNLVVKNNANSPKTLLNQTNVVD